MQIGAREHELLENGRVATSGCPMTRLPPLPVQCSHICPFLHEMLYNLLSPLRRSHVQRRVLVFVLEVGVGACVEKRGYHVAVAFTATASRVLHNSKNSRCLQDAA